MAAYSELITYDVHQFPPAGTLRTQRGGHFLIEVDRLNVSYAHRGESEYRALRNINLTVSPGEVVGVVGESGAGKSTLALALLGLLPPNACVSSGSILFGGRDILNAGQAELEKIRGSQIASVLEDTAAELNPMSGVGRQISEMLRAHRKWDKKRGRQATAEMFRRVGLPEARQVYSAHPRDMSAGERQRVAISRALVCEPSLLIADEPVADLDAISRSEVFACLKEANARYHMAILVMTHDPSILEGFADRVLILREGEMVEEADPADIVEQPVHLFTRAAMSALTAEQPEYSAAVELQRHSTQTCQGDDRRPAEAGSPGAAPGTAGHYPLLLARQLYKRYENSGWLIGPTQVVQALNGAGLGLRAGRTTSLIGESGCGKSTLARCLAALERPDSGELRLEGCDLLRLSQVEVRRMRRSVQLLTEDTVGAFNPWLTMEETVSEQLNGCGLGPAMRQEYAIALMKEVGLPESLRRRRAQELSAGQRQRLAVARALAASPKVLIFDGAFNALDVRAQAEMMEQLYKLQASLSLAYLFITSDLRLAGYITDDIAVMQAGRIVEYGSAAEVLTRPRHAHTEELLESIPPCHFPEGERTCWP
jgi:peptide/nickel transport system ATP-binding protein